MSIRYVSLAVLAAILCAVSAHAETARVITKENAIREQCRFFAPVKAMVRYNDQLETTEQSGDWFKVTFKGLEGCIHKTAIDRKNISLSGVKGTEKHSASEAEVSLAGKGFSPQVEGSFREKNPGLNFGLVDEVEKLSVAEMELKGFMESGGLRLP
jgi:hypothetical protein